MQLIEEIDGKVDKDGNKRKMGRFLCLKCKNLVERPINNGLKQKFCGCTKHNGKGSRLYITWRNMKQRILNPNNKGYKDYGGRGITICNEWLEFIPFRDWALSNGYAEGLQINRIINEGNYEPSNCNFVTSAENCQSRRNNKIKNMEIANEIRELNATGNYTQQELAEMFNVSNVTICNIINNKCWKNFS